MRTSIRIDTIRLLFALSGNECAFPGCHNKLISDRNKYIGQLCHIEAAEKGGERFRAEMTDEERRHPDNLLLLCYEHHIETNDVKEYTTPVMQNMKKVHEARFKDEPFQVPAQIADNVFSDIIDALNNLYRLSLDTNNVVKEMAVQVEKMQGTLEAGMKGPQVSEDSIHIAQLDTIRELKRKHKYQTVIELLLDFKEKHWEQLSPESKYRVIIQLGTTYLDLHQNDKGCETLLLLKDITHQTADGVAYLAYTYSLRGDKANFELWFEKGRQLQPDNLNLWLAYLTMHADKPIDELKTEIPQALLATSEMTYNLGETAYNRGEINTGIEYMLQSLEIGNLSEETLAGAKAVVASKILLAVINPFKHYFAQFTDNENELMKKANVLLSDAWDVLGNTELAASRWYILLNRGTLYKMHGEKELARVDLEAAFNLSRHINALKNLGHLYLIQNNFDSLDNLIAKYAEGKELNGQEKQTIDHLKVLSLFRQGKIDAGISIVDNWLNNGKEETRIESYSLLLGTLIENNQIDRALFYSEKMLTAFPENIMASAIRGTILKRSGDNDNAGVVLEKAYALVSPQTPPDLRYHLATSFMGLGAYNRAISLLENIADKEVNNEITESLIWSYYSNGDFSAVKFIATPLFEKHPASAMLAELLMNVYQDTRQQKKAIEIAKKFLANGDTEHNDRFQFKLATNAFQLSDWQEVKHAIQKIRDPLALSMNQCFQLADLFIRCGLVHEGKELGYRAVNKWYANSAAHAKFMQLNTEAESQLTDTRSMFPETVGVDCGVTILSGDGQSATYLITEGQSNAEKKLGLSDALAKALIGKKVNDEIIVDLDLGITRTWRITEIMDKYVFQLREGMHLFETRFIGQQGITVMNTSPGNEMTDMKTLVRNMSLHQQMTTDRTKEFYDKGLITIGSIATKLGTNPVRQWFRQVSDPQWETQVFLHDESANVVESVNNPVVIDLSALLTCFIIEGTDFLLANFPAKWKVSNFTLDAIQEFHDELNSHARDGLLTVSYENGQMVSHQTSKETIEKHVAQLKKIIDWCNAHAAVMVSDEYQDMNRNDRKKDEEIFGHSSMDTHLLAKQFKCNILSDDGTFKKVIKQQLGIKGFSTYQIAMNISGKIPENQLTNFFEKMIMHGYLYIPAHENILWSVFERVEYNLHPRFLTAVKGLRILQPQASAIIAAKFFKLLYSKVQIDSVRTQVVLVVLNELSMRKEFPQMKPLMLLAAQQLFALLPIQLVELNQMIALAGLRNSPLE